MLSVKQGDIKYHFLSLWYESTWDWTQVSRAIGEHSREVSWENCADKCLKKLKFCFTYQKLLRLLSILSKESKSTDNFSNFSE